MKRTKALSFSILFQRPGRSLRPYQEERERQSFLFFIPPLAWRSPYSLQNFYRKARAPSLPFPSSGEVPSPPSLREGGGGRPSPPPLFREHSPPLAPLSFFLRSEKTSGVIFQLSSGAIARLHTPFPLPWPRTN